MAKKTVSIKSVDTGIVSLLLSGASLTTLYFNTKIQDPFNSPKLWILSLIAAWSCGHLYLKRKELISPEFRILTILVSSFLIFGFVALLMTNPFYIGFFGENQRRNGYLAYLSLTLIFLVSAMVIKLNSVNKIFKVALIVGSLLSLYGLLQSSGLDFVKWNNPYNSVISTVGNPNFAASIMAIMATLNFGAALQTSMSKYLRIVHVLVSLLSLFVIIKSGALQGLIVITIGVGLVVLVYLFNKNIKLGYAGAFVSLVTGIFAILGMLQIGPLTDYLYKNSVSVRGYYWRAGIKMLQENPIFGVGLDRYGYYFKEVREPSYSLNYGFDITSNNAHNVPIQIFATGGIFVGTAYLAILAFIFMRGIKGLKKYSGNQRIMFATFFGAWLAFQSQTIISIDNIGVSIWGWFLGGVIVGLSSKNAEVDLKQNRISQIKLKQPLISGSLTLVMIVVASVHFQNENLMYKTRGYFNPQDATSRTFLLEYANKTVSTPWPEPAYKVTSANYLFAAGFQNEALEILRKLYESDPRNLDALISIVQINEQTKDYASALTGREKIRQLDPWNTSNLLQLGREYKFFNQFEKMREVSAFISKFDSTSNESKLAKNELVE